MGRASFFILPLLVALAACGDKEEDHVDGGTAEEQAADPMRMESDPADSIAEAKRMQAYSDSVRREVMRKAGLPEESPEPPEVPARPPVRNKAECLAQADSVGGGEGEVLRSACRNLPG